MGRQVVHFLVYTARFGMLLGAVTSAPQIVSIEGQWSLNVGLTGNLEAPHRKPA
jgi:hypothetical protein